MGYPAGPAYIDWTQLMYEWLHGHPFAGSGGHVPSVRSADINPGPSPWVALAHRRINPNGPGPDPAVEFLLSLAALKVAASGMSEGNAKSSVESGVTASIDRFLDDYCGTVPPGWFGHGPWPPVAALASGLAVEAGTLQGGKLQDELMALAARVLDGASKALAEG